MPAQKKPSRATVKYPGTPHTSLQKNLTDLLEIPPSTPNKCSFAITLGVAVKTTNGSGTLSGLNRYDTGSFAAEIPGP